MRQNKKIFLLLIVLFFGGCVTAPKLPLEDLVGKKQAKISWQSITLHHSATAEGNAEIFDYDHRSRGLGGLAYHFVIGNGSDSGDGEVEVGWRWREQKEADRIGDIQICLVGNFNNSEPTAAQFAALIDLLKALAKQYAIKPQSIRRHQDVVEKFTECPGSNFPFDKILAELSQ